MLQEVIHGILEGRYALFRIYIHINTSSFESHIGKSALKNIHNLKYTQYIMKRNTYIFFDNLGNFEDLHFKLAGYIDNYACH